MPRDRLPPPKPGEFYHADLIGPAGDDRRRRAVRRPCRRCTTSARATSIEIAPARRRRNRAAAVHRRRRCRWSISPGGRVVVAPPDDVDRRATMKRLPTVPDVARDGPHDFPEMFPGPLGISLAGKALAKGIWCAGGAPTSAITRHDKHRTVDDTPAGGGPGMVMRADVLARAIDAAAAHGRPPRLLMSPRGAPLTQARVRELAAGPGVVILCGRFEGVDERVIAARAPRRGIAGRFRALGRRNRRAGAPGRLCAAAARRAWGRRPRSRGKLRRRPAGVPAVHPARRSSKAGPSRRYSCRVTTRKIAAWRAVEAERLTRERRRTFGPTRPTIPPAKSVTRPG